MTGRVTLQDVADRAGTSRTTAHYVMTGRDRQMRISEDARSRVLQAATELHYRPNLMARGLRTAVTRTLALVTDWIASETYAGGLVYGSLTAAAARDHLLFIAESTRDPALESALIEGLLDRHVDGFLYATLHTRDVELPKSLVGERVVAVNCRTTDKSVPSVVPDEKNAGRSAGRLLLDAGHGDGIFVLGEPAEHVFAGRERLQGLTEELAASGTQLAGRVDCSWWPEPAFAAASSWLRTGVRPSALVCLNDRVALGAYQALAEHGLRVPADVSVVSFDDSDIALWLRPSLTSVALPHQALAERAVGLLLDGDLDPVEHRVPMPLRLRESVAPVRPN